jgi:hypothetical protein
VPQVSGKALGVFESSDLNMFSKDLLTFLDWLESTGQPFELDYLKGMLERQSGDPEADADAETVVRAVRHATSVMVQSRLKPVTTPRAEVDEFLREVERIMGDDPLDEYFTRLALGDVAEVVGRIKQLRALHVRTLPQPKIGTYFAQAVCSYLYGLPDAAVLIARSALQFSLEEVFRRRSGAIPRAGDRKGYLETLIDEASTTGLLAPHLAQTAHSIRKAGNAVGHERSTSHDAAGRTLAQTRQVIQYLYRDDASVKTDA